jgi:hypothetical protein
MKSVAASSFWRLYGSLPDAVRREAREAFRLFRDNPAHPGLSFERVHSRPDSWSVRITQGYRVVGRKESDSIVWYWIGSHADFDKKFRV